MKEFNGIIALLVITLSFTLCSGVYPPMEDHSKASGTTYRFIGEKTSCHWGGKNHLAHPATGPTVALNEYFFGASSAAGPRCGHCFMLRGYRVNGRKKCTKPVVFKVTDLCPCHDPQFDHTDTNKLWCCYKVKSRGKLRLENIFSMKTHFDFNWHNLPKTFKISDIPERNGEWKVEYHKVDCRYWRTEPYDVVSRVRDDSSDSETSSEMDYTDFDSESDSSSSVSDSDFSGVSYKWNKCKGYTVLGGSLSSSPSSEPRKVKQRKPVSKPKTTWKRSEPEPQPARSGFGGNINPGTNSYFVGINGLKASDSVQFGCVRKSKSKVKWRKGGKYEHTIWKFEGRGCLCTGKKIVKTKVNGIEHDIGQWKFGWC